jgi:hypothetical protein
LGVRAFGPGGLERLEGQLMRTEARYPYDPRARIEGLHGAEKLRAIPDRELASDLLRLLDAIEERPEPARPARQLKLPQPARWARCLEVA